MDMFVQRMLDLRIGQKYQLVRPLGSGSFGKVYLGRNIETDEEVAIKLEHYSVEPSLLEEEIEIYESLRTKAGFPRIFWHGCKDDFRAMVFELLGPNLEDLLCYCGGQFSTKTIAMLADQLLHRFQSLHTQHFLHRDVKPENFLMGLGQRGNVVHMTDLGLAWYRNPARGGGSSVDAVSPEPSLIGTCRYASINGHLDVVQSRADDLESLGYMLIYFAKGKLPWQGIRSSDRDEKYRLVLQMKQNISLDHLCQDLPQAFQTYMEYLRNLHERSSPNYAYLRKLFQTMFQREKFEHDSVFDWTILILQQELNDESKVAKTRKPTKPQKQKGRKRRVVKAGKGRWQGQERSAAKGTQPGRPNSKLKC